MRRISWVLAVSGAEILPSHVGLSAPDLRYPATVVSVDDESYSVRYDEGGNTLSHRPSEVRERCAFAF